MVRYNPLCATRSAGHAAGPMATASPALTPAGSSLAPLLLCTDLFHCAVHRSVGAAPAAMSFPPKGSNSGGFSQPPTSLPPHAVPWDTISNGKSKCGVGRLKGGGGAELCL